MVERIEPMLFLAMHEVAIYVLCDHLYILFSYEYWGLYVWLAGLVLVVYT